MMGETVVEHFVAALARGESASAVARACWLDCKTILASRQLGEGGGETRPTVLQLDPYRPSHEAPAPDVDLSASLLCRELRERVSPNSAIIVRRAMAPVPAVRRTNARVRHETVPDAQAQVDARVWIGDERVAAKIVVMTLSYVRRLFSVAFSRQRLREWMATVKRIPRST